MACMNQSFITWWHLSVGFCVFRLVHGVVVKGSTYQSLRMAAD